MADLSLQDMAQKMRHLDIATLTTVGADGALCGRPMSNNGDVQYDGNSYYFTYQEARLVGDIGRNPQVQLAFEGADSLYIAVSGTAELIRDKAQFEQHWQPELAQWFEQGTDTPGMVLVRVKARHIKYWQDMDSGEWHG